MLLVCVGLVLMRALCMDAGGSSGVGIFALEPSWCDGLCGDTVRTIPVLSEPGFAFANTLPVVLLREILKYGTQIWHSFVHRFYKCPAFCLGLLVGPILKYVIKPLMTNKDLEHVVHLQVP